MNRPVPEHPIARFHRGCRQRDRFDRALQKLNVGRGRLLLVLARKRQHLVGHVEAVYLARRTYPSGGQQDVDAAARSKVEDGLARPKRRESGRIPTAK